MQKVEREWNIVEAQQEQGAHERDFSVSDGWQVKYIDRRSTLLKRALFALFSKKGQRSEC